MGGRVLRSFLSIVHGRGSKGSTPTPGNREPGRSRGTKVFLAVAVVLGAVASGALGIGVHPAGAVDCTVGVCGPQNVTFRDPGSLSLNSFAYCGIGLNYGPLAADTVDQDLDNPAHFNESNDEGNYPDTEAFQFKPATQLYPGDEVTITLPHPTESYANSGSVLPPPTTTISSLSPGPTQDTSGSVEIDGTNQAFVGPAFFVYVDTSDPDGTEINLSALDPSVQQPLVFGTSQNVSNLTINGFDWPDPTNGFDSGNTSESMGGVAQFLVTDSSATAGQTAVFAATNVSASPNVPIAKTAVAYVNGGGSSGGDCSYEFNSPAPNDDTAYNYWFVQNGVAYPAIDVTPPTETSGFETVNLYVPDAIPNVYGSGDQVTIEVLDAVSPPGYGTNAHHPTQAEFTSNEFTISTQDDPVPSSPSSAPSYYGDWDDSKLGPDCYDAADTSPQIEPCTSTLASSVYTIPVSTVGGITETATTNDKYYNPVNDQDVEVYPQEPTTAIVTPQAPPPTSGNPNPAASVTGDDGTAVYSVTDPCIGQVQVQAVDDTPNVNEPFGTPQVLTFTPGQVVAPDSTTYTGGETGCGNHQSSITATPPTAAADGVSTSLITAQLGDEYGNAVPDTCVGLSQQNNSGQPNTDQATVVPASGFVPTSADGCLAGEGYANSAGVVEFEVSDPIPGQVLFSVFGPSIQPWPFDSADSASVQFEGVSQGTSNLTTSAVTAVSGNGQPAATVTVTLLDGAGNGLDGKDVTLASDPYDPTTTITPTGAVLTNSQGQAVFTVADDCATLAVDPCTTGSPRVVTYQATDTSDGVTISNTVSVTFTVGGATLSASPSSVVADGVDTSTLNYSLVNLLGTDVSGAMVTLTSTSGTATLGTTPTSTSGAGKASFTVSDTVPENVTYTATATFSSTQAACPSLTWSGGMCTVVSHTTVDFTPAPQSFVISASPNPVPADGITSSQVTVVPLDGNFNPIPGLSVQLLTTGNANINVPTAVTNSSGVATFSMTDSTNETVTLTAQYLSKSYTSLPPAVDYATLTFSATPNENEQTYSTITPTATAPADGTTTATVTVTLKQAASSLKLSGHSVVLSTGSATTTVTPSNVGGVTNTAGVVSFTITDTTPETLTVYARDLNTGVIINETAVVTFTPDEAQASTVAVSGPDSVPAGGPTAEVVVTLVNNAGGDIANHFVSLTASSSTVTIPAPAKTNALGQAEFAVSDHTVETVTFKATDTTANIPVVETTAVTFTPDEANQSSVTANPVSTPADGPPATVTVTARNAAGLPISGDTIALELTGSATSTPVLTGGVTNSLGVAQFWVSDTVIQTVTVTACDKTLNPACTADAVAGPGGLLDQTATITFTASEAYESSMAEGAASVYTQPPACPSPVPATWTCPTTTVTVTLRNAAGALITGDVVALSASYNGAPDPSVTISPATVTSSAGLAKFTVGDSAVQNNMLSTNGLGVVFSALDETTGSAIVATVQVNFCADEANQSTATAVPELAATEWIVTVTLRSAADAPVAGHTVTLTTGSTHTTVTDLTVGGKTTAAGTIQFRITDTLTQVLSVVVKDTSLPAPAGGGQLYQPVAVSIYK
jgi:Bacterial Ig-like domain (group 1)